MPKANDSTAQDFLQQVSASLEQKNLVKLLLGKYRGNDKELQRLTMRPITLRNETALSCVYTYKTSTITKNFAPAEALVLIAELLQNDFKSAHLHTDTVETQLNISKKGKASISSHKAQQSAPSSQQHNREKKRYVDIKRPFLTALGVTDQQQQLIPSMSRKWKQINKFIEVFSQALDSSPAPKDTALQVVDFGSGKGYLTFAIHDYLRHSLSNPCLVTGVELRQELADLCNNTAKKLEQTGLEFVCGDVKTHAPSHTDVMIALHACDTATDYAINYGIQAGASIIMCSPCCHKQIRPQMQSPALFKPMLQYGVHLGQEAEMVTDSLRALLLEAYGYSTKVFEFISLEHTNKNKMILAVKRTTPVDNSVVLQQIAAIKEFYGISEHCLESLLAQ
ncbi:SAM-dependent methyltransferase [Dasania marina]|uniref:class I SAM-dependent methyltransferase n=1 Tax=Dasania marina TaxID=471499 RepID=UPI0030DD5D29|tara:strand:+ start:13737 stop:14918 length:1182 start_codon:yes stop_codon:yes gene_type:complete